MNGNKWLSTVWTVVCLTIGSLLAHSAVADESGDVARSGEDVPLILPGDTRFNTPDFEDYQAVYTSSSSKTGAFTLQARKSGDGKKLSLIDIIPMQQHTIVAQRSIDLASHRLEFSAGPYFAWGADFVVGQSDAAAYTWSRVGIGTGDVKTMNGPIANDGYVSEMFSPTLASLMPMPIGSKFQLPEANPQKNETVSSEFDRYEVLRRDTLTMPSGISCECWVVEKTRWADGSKEHIWVSRDAPFVYRRHRDVGGQREFVSDLLDVQTLSK